MPPIHKIKWSKRDSNEGLKTKIAKSANKEEKKCCGRLPNGESWGHSGACKPSKKNYIALLTIYGLDTMKKNEFERLKQWLEITIGNLDKQQYAKVARFRLMK